MNDSTRATRRPCAAWPRHARTAAAITATAALALLAAACSNGGSPSPAGSGGSPAAGGSAVAYSACMRSNGVPNYPDPTTRGQLPKTDAQLLGVSTSRYQAGQQACQHLLPTGRSLQQQEYQCMQDNDCSPALVQQMMTADRKLARCMRSHGVPNFPDPTNGGSSGPVFEISKVGISDAASHANQFIAKLNACSRLVGANAPESFG